MWQLDRAEQKLSIQNDYQSQSSKDYINLRSIEKNPGRYTKIIARGIFREPYFLLDNIVYNKKAGYLVMSPFQVGDKIIIEFRSQSFLQQQVRSMVGCLKYVGEKKWSLNKFQNVMKSKKEFYVLHLLLQRAYFI